MNIDISISMVGPDSWTDGSGSFGQTCEQSHSFSVRFDEDEDICQFEALSAALVRLITAVRPPRLSQLLAMIVCDLEDDVGSLDECEDAFADAASKVCDFWNEHDKAINGEAINGDSMGGVNS